MDYDLVLKNGFILDVAKCSLFKGDVAVKDGIIVDVCRSFKSPKGPKVKDISGKYLSPGFVESHIHIESSLLSPLTFAREVIGHGTTSVFADPHEIANVAGKDGLDLFLGQSDLAPLDIYLGIPSCVPATDLEDAGGRITLKEIEEYISDPRIYGLGEMMNFPGIIHDMGDYRKRCDLVFNYGKIVDGHCPGITGKELDTYITNGKNDGIVRISSDHQASDLAEAIEKERKGMSIALRYGSASRDLDEILPGLIKKGIGLSRFMLCSDDVDISELRQKGHMERIIRRAKDIIKENSSHDHETCAIIAISLATLNPGAYFSKFFRFHNLPQIGEIAVGKKANLVILSSLKDIEVEDVVFNGEAVVEKGVSLIEPIDYDYSLFKGKVRTGRPFVAEDFHVSCSGKRDKVPVRVIEARENSIRTKSRVVSLEAINGELKGSPEDDIARIAVIERHRGKKSFSLGFVKGLGLKRGAVASTIAHDSHNIIVAGVDGVQMARAVSYLAREGGGMVVALGDEVAGLPLVIGGLMADTGICRCMSRYQKVLGKAKETGTPLENIFMVLSFLSLPVIPELRITNRGLVDVDNFAFVPLEYEG